MVGTRKMAPKVSGVFPPKETGRTVKIKKQTGNRVAIVAGSIRRGPQRHEDPARLLLQMDEIDGLGKGPARPQLPRSPKPEESLDNAGREHLGPKACPARRISLLGLYGLKGE